MGGKALERIVPSSSTKLCLPIVVALSKLSTHTVEELTEAKMALAKLVLSEEAGDLEGLRKLIIPVKGVAGNVTVNAETYWDTFVADDSAGGCDDDALCCAICEGDPMKLKKAIVEAQMRLRNAGNVTIAKQSLATLLLNRDLTEVSATLDIARKTQTQDVDVWYNS